MTAIHVTEAESAVLDALWRCGPLPPARLIEEVKRVRPWGDATIKTLLGRLMQKKAVLSAREDGRLGLGEEAGRIGDDALVRGRSHRRRRLDRRCSARLRRGRSDDHP